MLPSHYIKSTFYAHSTHRYGLSHTPLKGRILAFIVQTPADVSSLLWLFPDIPYHQLSCAPFLCHFHCLSPCQALQGYTEGDPVHGLQSLQATPLIVSFSWAPCHIHIWYIFQESENSWLEPNQDSTPKDTLVIQRGRNGTALSPATTIWQYTSHFQIICILKVP